jgi:hypothetical protein
LNDDDLDTRCGKLLVWAAIVDGTGDKLSIEVSELRMIFEETADNTDFGELIP